MHRRLHPPAFASRVAPAAYWSRRDLINRSYAWFRVIPRVIKPRLLEASREVARPGRGPEETAPAAAETIPGLRRFAGELLDELTHGSGVAYLSGLVAPELSPDDATLRAAYALLGQELGALVGPGAGLLDLGGGPKACVHLGKRASAGTETSFHTDSDGAALIPDLVGMLCLRPAKSGGECQVTSAFRAHELMRGRHGDLLAELYEPFIRGVVALASVGSPGDQRAAIRTTIRTRRGPVFAARDGAPGVHFEYMRHLIENAHEKAGQPLTATQLAAFDRLDEALADPAACVQFRMRRGDMLFVDNRAVAHNRRDFVDHAEPKGKRAMVRMWLSLKDAAAAVKGREDTAVPGDDAEDLPQRASQQ